MSILVFLTLYIAIGVVLTARERAKSYAVRLGAYNSTVGTIVFTIAWPVPALIILSQKARRNRFRVLGSDSPSMTWKDALSHAMARAREEGRSQTIGDEESGDSWWVHPDGSYSKD